MAFESGPISWSELQNVFGGINPIGLNEYYKGGLLVPDVPQNSAISTSGQISAAQFRGSIPYPEE